MMTNDKTPPPGKTMSGFDGSDMALDALFAEMRDTPVEVPPALLARIMEDAAAEMPKGHIAQAPASAVPVMSQRSGSGLRGLFSALGGWGGVGGLVSATVAGIWIGFADISTSLGVSTLMGTSEVDTATTVELMPGADAFATAVATGG